MPTMVKWFAPFLIALPVALVGQALGWGAVPIFVLALIAIVPLAGIIGHFTDELTKYVGERAGGLLDATFGNAPEIIIGFLLIINVFQVVDSADIVKALIVGSVVSNALFVLGTAILIGALRNGRMTFSADAAGSYASMLALAVAGLALPALAVFLGNDTVKLTRFEDQVRLSVVVAVILLVSYGAYLLASIFNIGQKPHPRRTGGRAAVQSGAAESEQADRAAAMATLGMSVAPDHPDVPETEVEQLVAAEEDDEARAVRLRRESRRGKGRLILGSLVMLVFATALTVVASILLVSSMDEVIHGTALTPFFVGFILLPFITNAVEQIGAINSAFENRMEETMAIAAGSGVQVALLVAGLLCLLSVLFGHPITLVFTKVELIVVTLVTFVYALVSLDGETTWLEGLQLIAFYLMVAATAFFIPGE
jgi:Ca2+:H+ antiporter